MTTSTKKAATPARAATLPAIGSKAMHDLLNPAHDPSKQERASTDRWAEINKAINAPNPSSTRSETAEEREQRLIAASNVPADTQVRPQIGSTVHKGASVPSSASRVRKSAAKSSARSQSEGAARRGAGRHGRDAGKHRDGAKGDASVSATTASAHRTPTARTSNDE